MHPMFQDHQLLKLRNEVVVTHTAHASKHDGEFDVEKFGQACMHTCQLTWFDLELRRRRHDARNFDATETE